MCVCVCVTVINTCQPGLEMHGDLKTKLVFFPLAELMKGQLAQHNYRLTGHLTIYRMSFYLNQMLFVKRKKKLFQHFVFVFLTMSLIAACISLFHVTILHVLSLHPLVFFHSFCINSSFQPKDREGGLLYDGATSGPCEQCLCECLCF